MSIDYLSPLLCNERVRRESEYIFIDQQQTKRQRKDRVLEYVNNRKFIELVPQVVEISKVFALWLSRTKAEL